MINPTDPNSVPQPMPIYNPLMPLEDEGPATSPQAPTDPIDPFALIDKQFDNLIKELSQQLTAIEKQLMKALRAMTATAAPKAPAPAPRGTGKPPGFHRLSGIVGDAARRYEVDPLLVNAVIRQESGFRADAVSKAGAMGLMQLMPATAKALGVRNPFDPRQNVEAGTALLRQLLDRYGGNVELALAAYNAGPEAVDKYGGVPPYPETQSYVRSIMQAYREAVLSA
jgi:soluble lytic murein transglycosylase-like protein